MSAHELIFIGVLALVAVGGLSILIVQILTGVPPMSSSAAEAAEVVRLLRGADLPERPVIYDLGSGWGSLAAALARAFPQADIRGVELSPLPYWVSRLRTRSLANVTLAQGDFFRCDLSAADAVTCYLMIGTMPKVAGFLDRALAPGTRVVSLSFWFRDRQVAASSTGAGLLGATALYVWPARKATDSGQSPDPDRRRAYSAGGSQSSMGLPSGS